MKYLLFISCVFYSLLAFSQNLGVINKQVSHFQLHKEKDTIDFLVIDTALTKKKPIFLFCQGSLPVPLFIEFAPNDIFMFGGGISNFDLENIKKDYHLVIISMPHTPVLIKKAFLNKRYCYIPDSSQKYTFDSNYVKADYLENYAKRANHVLHFLRKQKWIDNSKLVVVGHSQGSRIAAKIAISNKKVTHLGLFAANPFGRMDQNIREIRRDAEMKIISWEQADKDMEETYAYYKKAQNPDSVAVMPELLAWKSFSTSPLNDWLELKIPIYLGYGTADITTTLCDLVPLFFIQKGKTNLTYKRYFNMEHNFFEVDTNGKPIYEKEHWREVMNTFLEWAK